MNPPRTCRSVVNFGPVDRPMIGVFHESVPPQSGLPAVLLCGPMGQEGLRAHRFLRVMADRLARSGMRVFRFDYFATGDSGGDDLEGELVGWTDDVLAADRQLAQLAVPSPLVWVGLRLGAVLAARACDKAPRAPDAMVLLDPITDGSSYLAELALADRRAAVHGFIANAGLRRRLRAAPIPEVPAEALGFELSETLRSQLLQLDDSVLEGLRSARLTVIASPTAVLPRSLTERMATAGGVTLKTHRAAIDWATNDAAGTTIAPAELVALVVQTALESAR